MNWDQIESKWAAMTRRVRADWPTDRSAAIPKIDRRARRPEINASILTDRDAGNIFDTRQKTSEE